MAVSAAVTVSFASTTIVTWGVSGGTGAAPSVGFDSVLVYPPSAPVVTNGVSAAFVSSTASSFGGTGTGVVIPYGSVTLTDTPMIYTQVIDGALLGPLFLGATKDG